MKKNCFLFCLLLLPYAGNTNAEEPLDVAATYKRIARDYRLIESGLTSDRRAALGRITRDAYQRLIREADGREDLSADDLFALGACHEAVGNSEKSMASYEKSLEQEPHAKTHLALVRVQVPGNMKAAEENFAAAAKLQPEYPGLAEYHTTLAEGHALNGNWKAVAMRYGRFADYLDVLAERSPANNTLASRLNNARRQQERANEIAAVIGSPLPTIEVEHWTNGKPIKLEQLKGRVVVLDVFALWAGQSRARMDWVETINKKHGTSGLAVVGLTRQFSYAWDVEADSGRFDVSMSPQQEVKSLAAYAKEKSIGYRLGMSNKESLDLLAAETIPHTLILDKTGVVRRVLLSVDESGLARAESEIERLLK